MSQRYSVAVVTIVFATLLGACHSVKKLVPPNFRPPENPSGQLDQAKKALQDATPCCTSFADFSFQSELPWRPKKFEIGPGSSVFSLNGQRSYFLSFRLPADAKLPYRIGLKAELSGRWLGSSYLFGPTIVLLDDAFQPIGTPQDINLCEHVGWSSETTGAFGAYTVKEDKARYVVLFSSANQQSSNTYWEQSPAAFSAEAPVNMNAAGNFKIPHGPDGTVWIGVIDKAYADAVDNAVCGKAPTGDGLLNALRDALPIPFLSTTGNDNGDKNTTSTPSASSK